MRNSGPAVKDGKLLRTSVSQMQLFRACPRAWAWKYVARIPEPPPSPAIRKGLAGHKLLERFYKGLVKTWPLEHKRPAFAPAPAPHLLVEQALENPTLMAEEVPMVGYIDLAWEQEETVHLLDWKFKGDVAAWGSVEAELTDAKTEAGLQMVSYAAWAALRFVRATWAKLTHVQYQTRGPKDVVVVSADMKLPTAAMEFDKAAADVIPRMKMAALPHPLKTIGNYAACDRYGGCSYRKLCQKGDPNYPRSTLAAGFQELK